jgi:hypothetical protein
MGANRTVRSALTLLVAFVAVTGVLVGPAVADDHEDGEVTVGDNETGLGVDGNNTSVSVHVGGDGVTVGDDGVGADTGDVEATVDEAAGETTADGGGDDAPGFTVARTADDEGELPYNYSDLAPFYLIPGNRTLCQTVEPDPPVDRSDVPDNVSDRAPENPTPVNPFDPPGSPITQCDVVDPYSPPFDPTDVPDNPDGDVNPEVVNVGENGVLLVGTADGQVDDDWPGSSTIFGVQANPDAVSVFADGDSDDGRKDYDQTAYVMYKPGTQQGSIYVTSSQFGKNGGLTVRCDGDNCTVTPQGLPVGEQEFSQGGDDNESDTFPCEAPVGPGDAPDPPEDAPENPSPVDPQDPPGAAFGPCAVFDPNDPPVHPENPPDDPDADHNVYRSDVGERGVLFLGDAEATLDDAEGGPGAETLAGLQGDDETVSALTWVTVNDGQKDYSAFTYTKVAPQSATRVGPGGARVVAYSDTTVTIIGRDAGARITCDGTYCTVSNENLLLPDQEFQTARERNESDDGSDSESTSTTTSASTADPDTSTSSSDGSSTDDDGVSSLADARSGQAFTIPERTAPGGITRVPSTFRGGIPDAASVTGTLLELV